MLAFFDFSFRTFVTSSFVKVIYGLFLLNVAFTLLVLEVVAFKLMGDDNAGIGLLMMVSAPMIAMLQVLFGRMAMEVIMVIFRIAEDVRILAANAVPTE